MSSVNQSSTVKATKPVKPVSVEGQAARSRILAALQKEMPKVPTGQRYVAALLAVAVLMLLLPLTYLGLMALIAHTVYWYLVQRTFLFAPPIVGLIVLLFMIKPFFARTTAESNPQGLNREAEPFFFEYIAAICDAVGAPRPKKIRFECDVNASASFRRGLVSLFSHDLVLTIGTPLVAGLTVRQLTGIMAHEFGHFSQHTGMRLNYIVRSINMWLIRVTFERDIWDERIIRWSGAFGWWSQVIFSVARLCIYLTRVALFALAWVASAISFYLLRQMEFSADLYEASVIDLKTIRSTFERLTDLGVSQQLSMGDLQRFWTEGRLPDDFAALVVSNIRHLTPEIRKQIHDQRKLQTTGLLDTHPSDFDRLAALRDAGLKPGFQLDGDPQDYPATVLFHNFHRLSKAASAMYYRAVLGSEFDQKKLHSAENLIESRAQEIAAYEALDRYFQVRLPVLYPIPIHDDALTKPADPKEAVQKMKAARERMLKLLPAYKRMIERHDTAESSLFLSASAQTLLDCNLSFKPKDYGVSSREKKVIQDKLDRSRSAVSHLSSRMLEFETEGGTRLTAALQLLHLSAVVQRIPDGEKLRREMLRLLPDALFLSQLIADLLPMRILYRRVLVLWSTTRENEDRSRLIEMIIESMSKLHYRLQEISRSLGDRAYPFDHADALMTLQRFIIPEVPDAEDLAGLIFVTQEVFERLTTLQVRTFALLSAAAEKVESALGLPLLPQPKSEDAEQKSPDD